MISYAPNDPSSIEQRFQKILGYIALTLFGIGILVVPTTERARAGDVFAVDNVQVDVTSRTSSDARAEALLTGQRQALETILRRLAPRMYWQRLPDVGSLNIDSYLKGFRVNDEKTSPRRYVAELSISFKADSVRALMHDLDVPISEIQSRPALLLPVMEDRNGATLWSENWWRAEWMRYDLENSLTPLVLPMGDVSEAIDSPAEDVLAGNRLKIDLLKMRYDVDTAYVVHALADIDGQLGVTVYSYGPDITKVDVYSYSGQEDHVRLARKAVQDLMQIWADQWKRTTAVVSDNQTQLIADAGFDGAEEWRAIQKKLSDTDLIRNVRIKALSHRHAEISVDFVGTLDQLSRNLEQKGLRLSPGFQGYRLVVLD